MSNVFIRHYSKVLKSAVSVIESGKSIIKTAVEVKLIA